MATAVAKGGLHAATAPARPCRRAAPSCPAHARPWARLARASGTARDSFERARGPENRRGEHPSWVRMCFWRRWPLRGGGAARFTPDLLWPPGPLALWPPGINSFFLHSRTRMLVLPHRARAEERGVTVTGPRRGRAGNRHGPVRKTVTTKEIPLCFCGDIFLGRDPGTDAGPRAAAGCEVSPGNGAGFPLADRVTPVFRHPRASRVSDSGRACRAGRRPRRFSRRRRGRR